jgi:hypothetical protein
MSKYHIMQALDITLLDEDVLLRNNSMWLVEDIVAPNE